MQGAATRIGVINYSESMHLVGLISRVCITMQGTENVNHHICRSTFQ